MFGWHPFRGLWAAMIEAAPVKVWAQIGAAMVLTLSILFIVVIVWKGPWEVTHQGEQLSILGNTILCLAALVLVALAAITGMNINFHAGKDGFTGTVDRDEDAPPVARTTTVTETQIVPAATPPKEGA